MKFRIARVKCCPTGSTYISLLYPFNLYYPDEDYEDIEQARQVWYDTKPDWVMHSEQVVPTVIDPNVQEGYEYKYHGPVKVFFCPFCGVVPPPIRLKKKPPKKIMISLNGYYCATCDERLQCCECRRPEELWEIDD